MKKMLALCAIALATAAVCWAGGMSEPDAKTLWEEITVVSPYSGWGQWPDHLGMQEGSSPHGPLHLIYVNDLGLGKKGYPKPAGTIVVKENYTLDKKLAAVTVMYKVKGYNPEAGDWFWVKYGPDGMVQKAGKPAGCVNCHAGRAQNDFIMVSDY